MSVNPQAPWEYRQPHLPPSHRGGYDQFMATLTERKDAAPLAWRDGCATLAREWLKGIGLDPDNVDVLRAYLLGCGLLAPPLDLIVGLLARIDVLER